MARRLFSSNTPAEANVGFSRAVSDDEFVFVSGTTGFMWDTNTISDDLIEQVHQCFRNIKTALHASDATLADVVRVNYILQRVEDWPKIVPTLKSYFGDIRPAATAIGAPLVDPRMLIEIEVTARRPRRP